VVIDGHDAVLGLVGFPGFPSCSIGALGLSLPTVYRARDTLLKHDLIIVLPDSEDARRRYYQLRE
jgi:DNA-binding MarR family transcriptional regulator